MRRRARCPPEKPVVEDAGIKLFTDEKNAAELAKAAGDDQVARGISEGSSGAHQGWRLFRGARLHPDECRARSRACRLCGMRCATRKHVATCLGFGPRFLHSTGQAYKGGPNSGVFLQITCDDSVELPVPGQKYTFGIVKAAQARGDFQVLAERGRRALRVHLGSRLEGRAGNAAGGGSESSLVSRARCEARCPRDSRLTPDARTRRLLGARYAIGNGGLGAWARI